MLDLLPFVLSACGALYVVMHLRARGLARALRDAQANERRFRDSTELSADLFWETDASHRVIWISGGLPVGAFFGARPPSSLAYLRHLPVHKLKIDRSFLRCIDTHAVSVALDASSFEKLLFFPRA